MPESPTTPPFDVVDKTVEIIRSHFDVGLAVILTREHDPAAVPEYGETATIDGICRRIVAALLNSGWTPPNA